MRDSLTVLAILVIAALTAALVGPYFIDWNSHRAFIEAKLSEAAGAPVTIAGPIDVKLLPEPLFRLTKVTIGGAGAGRPRLVTEEIDVEIALAGLMRGEIDVVEARLKRPQVDLTAAADGTLSLDLPQVADPGRVSFQHLVISDGALGLTLARHGAVTLDGLDLEGEAAALNGPFKARGTFGARGHRHKFRLATGAFDGSRVRIKLTLDGEAAGAAQPGAAEPGLRPSLDLDGTLIAGHGKAGPAPPKTPAARSNGGKPAGDKIAVAATGPRFEGLATLAGTLPLEGSMATIPWRLTGHIEGDTDRIASADLEMRAGADLRAMIASGPGEARLDGTLPALRLKLHGPQLDLDKLAVAPDNAETVAPSGLDLLAQLSPFTADPQAFAALPLRFDLDYGLDTATTGSETFRDIDGEVHIDETGLPRLSFAAAGPEGAHLKLDGTFEPGPEAVFRGHVDASSRDLPRFAGWLGPAFPDLAASLHRLPPIRAFALSARADLSRVGVAARDLTLSLDRSVFAGTLSYTRQVGAERARIFADLSSDALDLEALPDLSQALAPSDLDLSLALEARAVNVSAVGTGPIDAGHVALTLTRSGADLRLERLDADLAGAKLTASGHFDGTAAVAEAHVAAARFEPLATLLGRLLPNAATAALRADAEALSPADLSLKLEAATSPAGELLPTNLSLAGTAAGTRLMAELKPDRPGEIDPAGATVSASLTAEAAEASGLMRQLGLTTDPSAAPGPGRIEAKAHGSLGAGFETGVEARFGPALLSFQGRAKPRLGNGRLIAKGENIAPLLRAAGLLPVAEAGPLPAAAEADLSWHDGDIALRHLAGHLATTGFGGDINLDLDPAHGAAPGNEAPRPALFGALTLDRLPAWALFGLVLGAPQPIEPGALWSAKAFGPPLARLPRTQLSLKIGALGLGTPFLGIAAPGVAEEAVNASLTLLIDRTAVTLKDFTGTIGGSSIGANLTLRRDGPSASLAGQINWAGLALDLPAIAGRSSGSLDLGGTGGSAAGLVDNLAGTGNITLIDARLARTEPQALVRVAAAIDRQAREDPEGAAFDPERVIPLLSAELDRAPLVLGTVTGATTLAGGMLRLAPLHVESPDWDATTEAGLNVDTLDLTLKTRLRARAPIADWSFGAPEATVALQGPLATPVRSIDGADFINGLQARAIARDQERIDIQNQDIRERASFNRRRKAIEADQEAAREQAKAEAEAAKAARAAEAAAKAEATKAAEADKASDAAQRAVDRKLIPPPLEGRAPVPDARSTLRPPGRPAPRERPLPPFKPLNIKPPASIIDEGATPPNLADPSSAGKY